MTDNIALREALHNAREALCEYACHAGEKVPCARSAYQCASECGKAAGDAIIKVDLALASPAPAQPEDVVERVARALAAEEQRQCKATEGDWPDWQALARAALTAINHAGLVEALKNAVHALEYWEREATFGRDNSDWPARCIENSRKEIIRARAALAAAGGR